MDSRNYYIYNSSFVKINDEEENSARRPDPLRGVNYNKKRKVIRTTHTDPYFYSYRCKQLEEHMTNRYAFLNYYHFWSGDPLTRNTKNKFISKLKSFYFGTEVTEEELELIREGVLPLRVDAMEYPESFDKYIQPGEIDYRYFPPEKDMYDYNWIMNRPKPEEYLHTWVSFRNWKVDHFVKEIMGEDYYKWFKKKRMRDVYSLYTYKRFMKNEEIIRYRRGVFKYYSNKRRFIELCESDYQYRSKFTEKLIVFTAGWKYIVEMYGEVWVAGSVYCLFLSFAGFAAFSWFAEDDRWAAPPLYLGSFILGHHLFHHLHIISFLLMTIPCLFLTPLLFIPDLESKVVEKDIAFEKKRVAVLKDYGISPNLRRIRGYKGKTIDLNIYRKTGELVWIVI